VWVVGCFESWARNSPSRRVQIRTSWMRCWLVRVDEKKKLGKIVKTQSS